MAFSKQNPRPYTKVNVESLSPNQNGVYGLLRTGVCVYVGKGKDIKARLLAHLNDDNPRITNAAPTHWVGDIVNGNPSQREKELILELNPVCNNKVG